MSIDPALIDSLLASTLERIRGLQRLPQSTYRLQLHKDFTFRDATALVPYLAELGISHVYASPYFKATPGSQHGYDVLDHSTLNPELGTHEDFDAMVKALADHGMSHLMDFVPNHVGVATNDNAWWNDVLANGPASRYAGYFDITWDGSPLNNLKGRLLLPLLGSAYGDALEKGELKLTFEDGTFFVSYYDRRFPLSPRTYGMILSGGSAAVSADIRTIIDQCEALPDRCDGSSAAESRHEVAVLIQRQLKTLRENSPIVQRHIETAVATLNGMPGNPSSFDRLDRLLQSQCFRLASWRTGPDEINYRRFFDVNSLAAIAMERLEVFEATHGLALSLLATGKASGMRIDHPDGLFDPAAYFKRLQQYFMLAVAKKVVAGTEAFRRYSWDSLRQPLLDRLSDDLICRRPLYVLGEKILAMNEVIPTDWPIHGTSGYDFLNMTNGLFVDRENADAFTHLYHDWIGDHTSYEELVYQKKKLILKIALASELHMLALELNRLAQRDRHSIDFTFSTLTKALKEVIACFPVYRSYISSAGVSDQDRKRIDDAVEQAIDRNPQLEPAVFHFIRDTLGQTFGQNFSEEDRASQRHFAGKFQQLTSPATAKGIEDTVFYIYNRLLSLNEVGGDPATFGVTVDQLHAFYQDRQQRWPTAMSTLSTHDTKRSEDVRARLNVLSEMPGQWKQQLETWSKLNGPHRTDVGGKPAPDRNDEYAIYQTLLGAWPEETAEFNSFVERIQQSVLKSMRESKVHTSWTQPNTDYETAVKRFLDRVLDRSTAKAFWEDFGSFQKTIAHAGHLNSLAQTVLKFTAPGMPDTYQGTEQWDLSLVDPDNRRPVDFSIRKRGLAHRGQTLPPVDHADHKLLLSQRLLSLRKLYPQLFSEGDYQTLQVTGPLTRNVFAFQRRWNDLTLVVAVRRFTTKPLDVQSDPTSLKISQDRPLAILRDVITGAELRASELHIADLFSSKPYCVLLNAPLPITGKQ